MLSFERAQSLLNFHNFRQSLCTTFGPVHLRTVTLTTTLLCRSEDIMAGLVLREDRDGLATLTLNRPEKLNSLNIEVFKELLTHVEALEHHTEKIGLVILRGAGKCFSAGHDLKDIATGEHPPRAN